MHTYYLAILGTKDYYLPVVVVVIEPRFVAQSVTTDVTIASPIISYAIHSAIVVVDVSSKRR